MPGDTDGRTVRNAARHAFYRNSVRPLERHCHALQQGLPIVEHTAQTYGEALIAQNGDIRRRRWEHLARIDVHVRELLTEYDKLAAQIAALTKPETK
jgi:hypothetical protein